jgi:hypothetical protein
MGSGYLRLFAQEMNMRSFFLNLTQILAGVALIMASVGVVHATQATGSKDPKYGKCYTKQEYDAKYSEAVSKFGGGGAKGGGRFKTVTDEYFSNNKRVPCK